MISIGKALLSLVIMIPVAWLISRLFKWLEKKEKENDRK